MTAFSTSTQRLLAGVLAEHFALDPDAVRPDRTLRDLEIDSLAAVELLVIAEARLGVELPADDTSFHQDITLAEAADILDRAADATGGTAVRGGGREPATTSDRDDTTLPGGVR